uniref:Putative k+-dependent ca2+/na+ exchanger nckx1 n=1 Tax=Lutzomyia longipalpis TaxID=7200 RepID=A0A7G3AI51_LUTLO
MGFSIIPFCIISSIICACFASAALNGATDTALAHDIHTTTTTQSHPILRYFYDPHMTLEERLSIERETWHWYPWKRMQLRTGVNGSLEEETCEAPSSIDDFPEDLFTQTQRLQGGILLHFLATIYFFTFLAIVVDDYFLPSVECICVQLKISKDVAAATFMATATTMPEFFTNCLATFLTKSDMGLGTIIGSMLFNTLGVAALASLAAKKAVQLDWWPLVRDSLLYCINIGLLTIIVWDGEISWAESMVLFIFYFLYFAILFLDKRIARIVKFIIEEKLHCCAKRASHDLEQESSEKASEAASVEEYSVTQSSSGVSKEVDKISMGNHEELKESGKRLWKIPRDASAIQTIWWFYSWPINFILSICVPNPRTHARFYPITFLMCIILIGANSYMIYFMISIIGHTFSIPESVMGLTFVAAGGCLPEAISCIITIRSGEGGMGVSNALGANSLAILLSLGLPWFIRNTVERHLGLAASINIHSYGIEITIVSLLLAVGVLFVVIALGHYELKRNVGFCLFAIYLVFITFAILVEMDVFFPSGNTC